MPEKVAQLTSANIISTDDWSFTINFTCKQDCSDLFTIPLERRGSISYGFNIFLLTTSNNVYQRFTCPMDFSHVSYSWCVVGDNQQNDEFADALEGVVTDIYKKSWVAHYFNFEVKSESGIVFFYNTSRNRVADTDRFIVKLRINDKAKLYFNTSYWWTNFAGGDVWPKWIRARVLSNVTHGFQTANAPGSKSLLFYPPYFVVFKASGVSPNFLSFTDFQKPNAEESVLSMIVYDEEHNILIPQFSPELLLPYNDTTVLSNVLEFKLLDSKKNIVQVSDKSQLFILLTML